MYTKDISEIIVDGEQAYKSAKEFVKILSQNNLKKIKENKKNELPLFQRFQVEAQLDKLHDTNVQLESGGYLVINPTEALVSIDVNSKLLLKPIWKQLMKLLNNSECVI